MNNGKSTMRQPSGGTDQLQPILGFAGLTFADFYPGLKISPAAGSIGFAIVGADRCGGFRDLVSHHECLRESGQVPPTAE